MGLAEDLKALQELRDKGEMSEPAYAAARDATVQKYGTPSVVPRKSSGAVRTVLGIVVLLFLAWIFLRVNFGSKPTNQAIATIVRAPVTVIEEVENLPAHSWKAVALNLPYGGTVEVNLQVVRGNPVDVFITTTDQVDAMKKEEWSSVRVFSDFNALKTQTYRRTGQLSQGNYYLVMRDLSLGILSAHASDISVKVVLNP